MSDCCQVPTGDLLDNLITHECVPCKKCVECHHCLRATGYLREAFMKPRSIQKFMDTEEEIDDVLDAVLAHQGGAEPPRYILVGPKNEIVETFPRTKKTLKISPTSDEEVESDTPVTDAVQKLVQGFPSSKLTVQQNLKLLSSKLTRPQNVSIGIEPISSKDGQTTSSVAICIETDSDSEDNVVENPVIHRTIFRCDKCEKTFTNEKDLTIHSVYHSVEDGHTCDICGASFKYSYELIKHNLQHTEKNASWVCKLCKKIFRNALEHTVHMGMHNNEKPFACDICGKRFDGNFKLQRHFRTHTDIYPFQCEKCSKKCRTMAQLRTHNMIHDGVMNYTCAVCERQFRHHCNLKTHLLRHHKVSDASDASDK
ncbi:hypothetical protein JTE90_002125 [Oedothorax gibbosus]|uniref:C2H2-type domain-containing protein n=1 Tax=Oedothorax gibbosus TaxID=931172 RepID=A0AAV6V994_9ARAC|nr:hypothetical protein JTE90_002125 [Oedothorax gibbosus]